MFNCYNSDPAKYARKTAQQPPIIISILFVCVCEQSTIRVQSSKCGITYQKGTEISPHNFNPDSTYGMYIWYISFMCTHSCI